MTEAIQEPEVETAAGGSRNGAPPTSRRRRRALLTGAVLVIVAAVGVVAVSDPFSGGSSGKAAGTAAVSPSQTATVTRGTLSQQVNSSGTLGYVVQADGSPYSVVNQASGTLTRLPSPGAVIHCGDVLYRVGNDPVLLLCGSTPAYRSLSEGDAGPDVTQLKRNLVGLGYASKADIDVSSNYFGYETAYALEQLQHKLGEEETGSLTLGQAVFLPGPLRVTKTAATLGTTARPGMPIMQATSTARQVEVALDASEQSSVKVGDKALITLPDNTTTPGLVSRIGTVASSGPSSSSSSGSGSSTTIPVYVTLSHPEDARGLDQAPVQVQITTAGVKNALIVPVDSLLARAGGRYAVETINADGGHHLVAVTLGAFDDADGTVEVTGNLHAGEQIAVPSI